MALLPWDDDPTKQENDIFAPTPVKQVTSVQSGAWQPAQSGADTSINNDTQEQKPNGGIFSNEPAQQAPAQGSDNYLLSDQKAQVDEQKAARDAEIEAAREQDAARKQAEQRAAAADAFNAGQVTDQNGQKVDVNAVKADDGWKKYYDAALAKEKQGMNFWDRLLDGGQASKRAEVAARNQYNNEVIAKAYDQNGNTLDPNAARQAQALSAYNSALADANSTRTQAISRMIGATKDNSGTSLGDKIRQTINAEKQMSIFDAIFGVDDTTRTGIDDLGRFGGGLVQGVGTMPVLGAKELTEALTGSGTNYNTGFEDNLNGLERGGRAISGALNTVTPFVGGSGKLLESLTSKVAQGVASDTEKALLQRLTSQVLLPATEQAGIGGAQAGAEYFGNGNTITGENGKIDPAKVLELAKQTGESAALGFGGGALTAGGAMGINRLRGRNAPVLTPDEIAQLELNNTNAGTAQLATARANGTDGVNLNSLENTELSPIQREVGDGISRISDRPNAPAENGLQPIEPLADPSLTPIADAPGANTPDTFTQSVPAGTPVPQLNADGIATPDVTPAKMNLPEAPADVTPVKAPVDAPAPVADGVVAPADVTPVRNQNVPTEDIRSLQDARAGKSQAEEAAINQRLNEIDNATPQVKAVADKAGITDFSDYDGNLTKIDNALDDEKITPEEHTLMENELYNRAEKTGNAIAETGQGNLPDGMNPTETIPAGVTPLSRKQVAERLMPKLADNTDVKQQIANAAGMSKDTESPLADILRNGNVNPKRAERITNHFNDLEKQLQEYNGLEEQNQKAYAEGGTNALDENVSRQRSRVARDMGTTTRRLMTEIKKLEGSRDKKVALINGIQEMIGTRNANVLTSAGLIERNMAQELTANAKLAIKNPIKMAKSTFQNGNILADTAKGELSHWKDAPKSPLDALHYVVGNTYRTAMIPTTALANVRRGAVRDELTRWAYQELEGRKVSASEAHKLSGTAGNEMEALVNTFIGADNGMTNRKQATDALKAWKDYIRTGDDSAKTQYLSKVEAHSSLADQMIAGLGKEDQARARGLKAMGNLIFPFVRTASNLAKTTVQQDLNPFAKSLLDEIRADQRSGAENVINTVKSKLVDYGIMGGAAALATSGALVYNDGDQVDKPKGWSLHIGGSNYVPVRATSVELPVALAGTAQKMAEDIAAGKARNWQYYAGMVTGSLPYIDQFNQTTGVVDSLTGMGSDSGDGGYAAKSYGINTVKSFVPFSNNGVQPYVAGKEGASLNAKTVYDRNLGTWLKNAVQKNYDPNFYNGLKDSRDNAGRVRTVDNQGVISNKTINDAPTAEFNQRVTDLVNYGRENGLGQNTQDMFNTYDTGKNNNFKSIQDAITFLDVPDGSSPDAAKKLEKNGKLAGLAQQMRDGFFGDTGSDLLQLDGQALKSDASTPNGAGSKNSKLPISMQSIKNAIAQTDISKDDSDKLYAISNQSTDLYNQLHNKQITYDQYKAAKDDLSAQETNILSGSKNYQKMLGLFDELDQTGFFKPDGLGATKSGQTYLWNSLNALLGSKGATPAAEYADTSKSGFTPWNFNRGTGRSATNKPGDRGNTGIQWTPVKARQAAAIQAAQFTPFKAKVQLGNEIKKDKSQNYSDRSF